jgi:acyl dehydratase
MRIFDDVDALAGAKGEHLGYGDWHIVTQEQVNMFADATGDHQWIHVDREKASAGPFGTTIAHGYLTLSLIPVLAKDIYRVEGLAMGINYGTNKVRFPSVVPVGSRIRAGVEVIDVQEHKQGKQLVNRITIEIDGNDKPACVAEAVVLLIPAPKEGS